MKHRAVVTALAVLAAVWSMPAMAADKIDMQEFMVPAVDPGIQLYVRNKHPAGVETFAPDRILIYVHGATYPSETAFDLPVEGSSMMDQLAERGWDVWMLDVRGYSRSTRPPEMDQPGGGRQADRRHGHGGAGCRRGGGFRAAAAQGGAGQPHGLVMGHVHHGAVHDHA